MIITPLPVLGAFLIQPELQEDERGFFTRTWCVREFERNGLDPRLVQCSVSFNRFRGTIRGMHYQRPPAAETKLVRCTHGAVYDVILDLRPDSPTFERWHACELTQTNHCGVYIPQGVAHGFQTLENDTELFYQISEFYTPSSAAGIRWNDPRFAIQWPVSGECRMSSKDRSYSDFTS